MGGLDDCMIPPSTHRIPRTGEYVGGPPDHGIYVKGWDEYDWDRYHKYD